MRGTTLAGVCEGRDNNLDFLRFALATLVLYAHACKLLYGIGFYDTVFWATRGQMDGGALAVNGFFTLSGFLITASWTRRKSAREYLGKRVRRIAPGLFAMLAFCLLLAGPVSAGHVAAYFTHLDLRAYGNCLLMGEALQQKGVLANVPFAGMVSGSVWTILYEFDCYLMVMLLGLCGLLRPKVVLGLLAVVFSAYVATSFGGLGWLSRWHAPFVGYALNWPRLGTYFLAGMAAYLWRGSIPFSPRWAWPAGLLLAACCWGGLAVALPVAGAYLLFMAAFHPALDARRFGRHGDFSYGLYLYGFTVQQLLVQWLGLRLIPLSLFLLSFAATLALAMLSWRFVERPFLRRPPVPAAPAPSMDAAAPPRAALRSRS